MSQNVAIKVFKSTGTTTGNAASTPKIEGLRTPDVFKDVNTVAAGSIVTVWTPASGKRVVLMGFSISVSAQCSVLFEDNAAGAGNFVYRTPVLAANSQYTIDLGNGVALSAVDNVLKATSSAAANVTGTLYGIEL